MTEPAAQAEHDATTEAEENGNGATGSIAAQPVPVLDRLREQYATATEDRRLELTIVPGRFDGNLAALYGPVDWKRIRRKVKRAAKAGFTEEAELDYAASLIVEACETILVRPEGGGDFVPLHSQVEAWRGGEPVRYDTRLCQALGIEGVTNPTAICRLVFKNPSALNDHFVGLDQWIKEAAPDEDGEDDEGSDRPT
jgi:hypothetical protein